MGKRVRGDGRKRSPRSREQRGVGVTHAVDRTLRESVLYPKHEPRTRTEEYVAIRHQIIDIEDAPCLSCGVRNSTLDDPTKNPYHATDLELHHVLEWSLANALDVDKINQRYVPILRRLGYGGPDITAETLMDFVDHNRYNCIPLCSECHRSPERGIHSISFPIVLAAALVRDDFDLIPGDDGQPAISPRRPAPD